MLPLCCLIVFTQYSGHYGFQNGSWNGSWEKGVDRPETGHDEWQAGVARSGVVMFGLADQESAAVLKHFRVKNPQREMYLFARRPHFKRLCARDPCLV